MMNKIYVFTKNYHSMAGRERLIPLARKQIRYFDESGASSVLLTTISP